MRISTVNKKWISWIVIFCFLSLFQAPSAPARPEGSRSGTVAAAASDDETPLAIEKESESGPGNKKKSILPWLLAGAGVVAAGALVYLLVIKKPKYTLTVTMGDGVNGTPTTGTYTYKKGETVDYGFVVQPGFKSLTVQLDGTPVAASGAIKMDGNHTLNVSAASLVNYILSVSRGTGVNGVPETGTISCLEGSDFSYAYSLQTGFQDLKVLLDGTAVAASGIFTMNRNHTLDASATASVSEKYYRLDVIMIDPAAEYIGYPRPGTYWYLEGTVIFYQYERPLGPYYTYLESVCICSPTTPPYQCSGSFVMNGNRVLSLSSNPK